MLEIGCDTGQATVPFAERGLHVTAVELGSGLAAIARRKLAAYPEVDVVEADFEDWRPPHTFDAVVAATSFHWLDPATRLDRISSALRSGGSLAVIATHHVAGGDTRFVDEVQSCYEKWMPGTPKGLRLAGEEDVPRTDAEELERSGRFADVQVHRYMRDIAYTTREYRDLLTTYSGHRALEPSTRDALLGCISGLIDDRFDGRIVKRYLTELTIATCSE